MAEQAPKKLVLSLVKHINENKSRVQSINGELGAEVKDAVENKHLHSGAMKLIARLARMDGDKCAAFLNSFDLYRDYAVEANLFGQEHVGDLVEDADQRSDIAESNVRKLRRGIRQTEEAEAPADVA